MKRKFTFDSFKKNELSKENAGKVKGGKIRFRRPSSTTTTAIWDDVEIRKQKESIEIVPDLVIRFSNRGG